MHISLSLNITMKNIEQQFMSFGKLSKHNNIHRHVHVILRIKHVHISSYII